MLRIKKKKWCENNREMLNRRWKGKRGTITKESAKGWEKYDEEGLVLSWQDLRESTVAILEDKGQW